MKWHLMNDLQLFIIRRLLTERLEDGPVSECSQLYDSVKADLDALIAEQGRRQQQRLKRAA